VEDKIQPRLFKRVRNRNRLTGREPKALQPADQGIDRRLETTFPSEYLGD